MHAYIHACMHTYIHAYIHTYIPTYIHTYTYLCIYQQIYSIHNGSQFRDPFRARLFRHPEHVPELEPMEVAVAQAASRF